MAEIERKPITDTLKINKFLCFVYLYLELHTVDCDSNRNDLLMAARIYTMGWKQQSQQIGDSSTSCTPHV